MARDAWEIVADDLRPYEAEMLRELLESAAISAHIEAGTAGPFPMQYDLSGARVLVPATDAPRAREIVASSGIFAEASGDVEEIPESEWRAPPLPSVISDDAARAAADENAERRMQLWTSLDSRSMKLGWAILVMLAALLGSARWCK